MHYGIFTGQVQVNDKTGWIRALSTHDHAVKRQLSVHFELIGRCNTFACVEEHVRELKREQEQYRKELDVKWDDL